MTRRSVHSATTRDDLLPAARDTLNSTMTDPLITTETALAGAAVALGADKVGTLSRPEAALVAAVEAAPMKAVVAELHNMIAAGGDPLGDIFSALRTPNDRRPLGATYTPPAIVEAMVAWAAGGPRPDRIVDPGAGSGRFALAAGKQFPKARIVAVEIDPLAALCARANLYTAGLGKRSTVVLDDFRAMAPANERTLWIGNPPYVRHHQIAPDWKDWLTREAGRRGLLASQLAGLHVHFYLATVLQGRKDDVGCYITSAEWMDVNYGSLVRQLLLDGLGGQAIHVLDPKAAPFADAATTGAITCFQLGSRPTSMKVRSVESVADLGTLERGRKVARDRLADAPRWSLLLRPGKAVPAGYVELGELCRVHRGTVTGANDIWVAKSASHAVLPASVLTPSVTKARELFAAGAMIESADALRRVVDLPENLDEIADVDRDAVDKFLVWAKKQGGASGYVARHRKAWWSVGMRAPAPILATYMARRPPAFVRNLAEARHINVAHGLYPRQTMTAGALDQLATSLRTVVTMGQGRTYAGGLTKFEPREMERIPVPVPTV